jgi:hypothetical protein
VVESPGKQGPAPVLAPLTPGPAPVASLSGKPPPDIVAARRVSRAAAPFFNGGIPG